MLIIYVLLSNACDISIKTFKQWPLSTALFISFVWLHIFLYFSTKGEKIQKKNIFYIFP